jgi:hypothetical protein
VFVLRAILHMGSAEGNVDAEDVNRDPDHHGVICTAARAQRGRCLLAVRTWVARQEPAVRKRVEDVHADVSLATQANRFTSPFYLALREAGKDRTLPTIKREGHSMARIIVTTDSMTDRATPVLLDESVYSIHLDNEHNAAQLIERLGWAITDAEDTQRSEQAL